MDCYPEAGRIALFYANTMPHEVMPSFRDRKALTVWYYDLHERTKANNLAKSVGTEKQASEASQEDRLASQGFIRMLMDPREPNENTCKFLAMKAEKLSPAALDIAASVTGAENGEMLLRAVKGFDPPSLLMVRNAFGKMGL